MLDDYGLRLAVAEPDSVGFFRFSLREGDDVLTVRSSVNERNPLFAAGLDQGSEITHLNGVAVTTTAEWEAALRNLKIGERYTISFKQMGQEKTGEFTAAASPRLEIIYQTEKVRGKMKKLRAAWLGID